VHPTKAARAGPAAAGADPHVEQFPDRLSASYIKDTSGVQGVGARAASSPSTEAIAACDEYLLDEIWDTLQLIGSYTNSALEAARRGDRDEIRLRLRIQLRDCFRHAVKLHDLLSTESPKGAQQ
jgi:hypothetical protein